MTASFSDADRQVRALLTAHSCPLPFHQVRAFVMGSIACPGQPMSPQIIVYALWGGKMPSFKVPGDAADFFRVFTSQLWHPLTAHQNKKDPFKLIAGTAKPTMAALGKYVNVRMEEMCSFFDGICGPDDELEMPSRVDKAMDALSDMAGLLAGVLALALDKSHIHPKEDIVGLLEQVDQLTEIAEKEINASIIASVRARNLATNKAKLSASSSNN